MNKRAGIAGLLCFIAATLFTGRALPSEVSGDFCSKNSPAGFLEAGASVLRYAVNVLMFTDAAETEISSKRVYVAGESRTAIESKLRADTKGIASIFSNGLRQEHTSLAVEKDGVGVFVSKEHILIQKGGLNPIYLRFNVDYEKRKLYKERSTPVMGGEDKKVFSEWDIPPGTFYEDPLVVLLNFQERRRSFPAIGEEIIIRTLPFEGDLSYDIIRIYRQNYASEGMAMVLVDAPKGFLRKGQRTSMLVLFRKDTLLPVWAKAEKVVPLPFPFPDGDAEGSLVCFGGD